jgi:hypothetical protein
MILEQEYDFRNLKLATENTQRCLKNGSGYLTVPYGQIRNYLTIRYQQIRNYKTIPLKRESRGGTWEGTGGSGIGAVGSGAGGDNRKKACSAQRRVGLKARPTAKDPAPWLPLR